MSNDNNLKQEDPEKLSIIYLILYRFKGRK